VAVCEQILLKQVHVFEEACYSILLQIMNNGAMSEDYVEDKESLCINVYDIRLNAPRPDCGMNGPPDLAYVSTYLNRQDVMSHIHVNGKKTGWEDTSRSVYSAFQAFHSKPSINLLPDLLRRIPVVLYNGEYDLICNHLATENMLDGMTWNNETGFNLGNGTFAPTYPWIVEGESAGLIRYARNLTYILFYNAGHMVPYNQARRSHAMLHQFIQLNSTYPNNQTIENDHLRVNEIMHRSFTHVKSIGFVVIITVIVFIGIFGFFVCKRQQSTINTLRHCPYIFRSKQQSVVYSRVNNLDEDFVAEDDTTLV
jgi:carboxypeptidase C (cathepsin A)